MKYRLICIALLLCVLLSACGGKPEASGEALFAERGSVERQPLGDLAPAGTAETLLTALSDLGETPVPDWEDEAEAAPRLRLAEDAAGADALVTDGSYIYMLDSYGLIVCSAAGAASEILSYTKVDRGGSAWSERLFLEGDRLAAVSAVSEVSEDGEVLFDSAETRVILLDVSDKGAPSVLAEAAVEGALLDACLLDGYLCLVAQRTLTALPEKAEDLLPRLRENDKELRLKAGDVYVSAEPAHTALTVAASVRMTDGRFADALAFTDGVDAVYPAGDALWLSRTLWSDAASAPYKEEPYTVVDYSSEARTELRRLRLEKGLFRLDGGCVLEGVLPDAGALAADAAGISLFTRKDSRGFSAYTDPNHGWTNYELRRLDRSAALSLLDGEGNAVGALTALGGEESAGACRFVGGLAWMTAGDAAAVYTADLSDPKHPKTTGSLPCEGETLLLRAFGEGRVLGLAPAENGWELVMYDVTDPAPPRELDSRTLDDPAPAGDPTARGVLFADPASGLVGLPAAGDDGNVYLLVRWTGEKWKQKGAFALEYVPANARGLLLNGLLYICSPGEVYVTDPDQMRVLATVSNAVG